MTCTKTIARITKPLATTISPTQAMMPADGRDEPDRARPERGFSEQLRLATEADMPAIRGLIVAAYAGYQDRMDRPPGPVLTDYTDAVAAGRVWVLGDPLAAVLVLDPLQDSMLV